MSPFRNEETGAGPWWRRRRLTIGLLFVLITITAAGILARRYVGEKRARWHLFEDPGVSLLQVVIPESQQDFVAVVDRCAAEFSPQSGKGSDPSPVMARMQALDETRRGSRKINAWRGRLLHKGNAGDGKAFVTIDLLGTEKVRLKTWNCAGSDRMARTLIAADSPLREKLGRLSEGDSVVFSGEFVGNKGDFLTELSVSRTGSMKIPQFLFRFSDIAAAEPSGR